MRQLLEHQRAREHRGHRVRDPLSRERGRGAVHGLEQAGPTRVEVGARREAEPADEPGAQVRQNVPYKLLVTITWNRSGSRTNSIANAST